MNTQGNHYVNMDETVLYENVNSFELNSIYAPPPRLPKVADENNYNYFDSGKKFNYPK